MTGIERRDWAEPSFYQHYSAEIDRYIFSTRSNKGFKRVAFVDVLTVDRVSTIAKKQFQEGLSLAASEVAIGSDRFLMHSTSRK